MSVVGDQQQMSLGPAASAAGPGPMRIPAGYRPARCSGCGQRIFWVTKVDAFGQIRRSQKTGRPIKDPIDPWPVPDGEIVLRGAGRAENVPVTVFHDGERWRSHFRTCPKARDFSGRGRRAT